MSANYSQRQTAILSSLGQVLVDLSASNIKTLLSEAYVSTQARREQATNLLARLKQLNPAVADKFQLKQHMLSQLQLRLICSNPAASGDVSSFVIVSYCWHYPKWVMAPAAKDIAPGWEISAPMVNAVMSLRESQDEGVWLDKLCINQQDSMEKKVQVGAMDFIYRSARRVVILLEDVQLSEEEEAAGLAYADFYKSMSLEVKDRNLEGEEKMEFVDAYFPRQEQLLRQQGKGDIQAAGKLFAMKLLGARWFSRAWCAHESRVVPHGKVNNPLFLCFGHEGRVLSFEFRVIHYVAMYLMDAEPEVTLQAAKFNESINDPNPVSLRQRWWRIQRLMAQRSPNESAMQHLVSILSFGCFYQGDLMSIALNTSNIHLSFVGDVVAMDEIIWIFSLLVLATNDVVPLVMHGDKMRIEDGPRKGAVSWAVRPIQGVLDETLPISSPKSITTVSRDYIELDLLLFKSLPRTATEESLAVASQIMEKHQLSDLAEEFAAAADEQTKRTLGLVKSEVHRVKGDAGPLKTFLAVWLSHAIDCGLEWTLRFPEVMREATEGTWQYGTLGNAIDTRLKGAASTLLSYFFLPQKDKLLQKSYELEKLTRFLTCILDPRLIFFTAAPRRLPCGAGDFAITPSISNRSWIAIPAAIAHLPSWQKRAWVIEPFDHTAAPESPKDHLPDLDRIIKPDDVLEDICPVLSSDYADRRSPRNEEGAWRLRDREIIFGYEPWGDFTEIDNSSLMLLKTQRVYGAEKYNWGAISGAIRDLDAK